MLNCSWGPLWLQGKEGKGAKGEDASAAGLQFVTLWERKSWPSQSLVSQFEDLPWFLVSYSTPILFWWWFTVAAIAILNHQSCHSHPFLVNFHSKVPVITRDNCYRCYHRVNQKMTATNPSTPKDSGDMWWPNMVFVGDCTPNDSEIYGSD